MTRYDLRDGDGRLLAVHVRRDWPDGHKTFTWEQPDSSPGLRRFRVADLPLYGVRLLRDRPGESVVVVEGEKAAQAILDAGRLAVGTVTGASLTPSAEALRPLADRQVFLWPDNDEPGRRHMASIAALLRQSDITPRMIAWHDAPPGGDAADFIDLYGGGTVLDRLLEEAQPISVPTGNGHLAFIRVDELLAQPEEHVRWLVEGRLPTAGLSLLAGKPKAGKSTLARCLALAVARGTPWLDFATLQGAVLYLALDEKIGEVRAHFEAMGTKGEEPVLVFCERAPQGALELLRREAEQRRPMLIIIDPLLKLVRVKDGNDYAEVTRALEPLLALARETGAHVLAVHHLGKGDRSGGDAILGSTAIFAAVDTALLIKRSERYRTLSSIQRYGDDLEEVTLALDPETRWITAGLPRQEADEGSMAEAILEYLATQEAPVEEAAIREVVEGRKAIQVRALRRLVEQGRVIRTGQGRRGDPFLYALPDSGFLVPNISREPAEPEIETGQKARPDAQISGSRDSAAAPAESEMAGIGDGPAGKPVFMIRRAQGWRCTSPPEVVRRAVRQALHRQLPPLARRAVELFDATILEVRAAPARQEPVDA